MFESNKLLYLLMLFVSRAAILSRLAAFRSEALSQSLQII